MSESNKTTDALSLTKRVNDAYSNINARLGFGSNNLVEQSAYAMTRLTRNYPLLLTLYRNNWIVRKLIDCPAVDLLKNWIEITAQITPEQVDQFDRVISKTRTKIDILSTLRWARLFGGSGAVICIAGHEDILDQPLDINSVELDSYKGLLVFDRWSGITPGVDICTDLNRPHDFGYPEHYRCNLEDGGFLTVHASRIIRFQGRDLPKWERQVEQHWGISEIELIFEELKRFDYSTHNTASMMSRSNVFVVKQSGITELMAMGTTEARNALSATLSNISQMLSGQGLMFTDTENGDVQNMQYSFGGVADVLTMFMLNMCRALEMPMSRLFGRTQTGLGQSNDGDERIYFDSLTEKQNREIRPQLEKLFPVIAMSTWGQVPDDLDFDFLPVRTLNDHEQAELAEKVTTAIIALYNSGLISQKTALMEIRHASDVMGIGTQITDEMIEAADDTIVQQSELEMMKIGQQGFGDDSQENGKSTDDK